SSLPAALVPTLDSSSSPLSSLFSFSSLFPSSLLPRTPTSTLFPYTTLFRSIIRDNLYLHFSCQQSFLRVFYTASSILAVRETSSVHDQQATVLIDYMLIRRSIVYSFFEPSFQT